MGTVQNIPANRLSEKQIRAIAQSITEQIIASEGGIFDGDSLSSYTANGDINLTGGSASDINLVVEESMALQGDGDGSLDISFKEVDIRNNSGTGDPVVYVRELGYPVNPEQMSLSPSALAVTGGPFEITNSGQTMSLSATTLGFTVSTGMTLTGLPNYADQPAANAATLAVGTLFLLDDDTSTLHIQK